MVLFASVIFFIFLTGTIFSGWFLYRLIHLETRCWQSQHRLDEVSCN